MSKEKIDIKSIIRQVKKNCDISDAKENLKGIRPRYIIEHLFRHEKGIKSREVADKAKLKEFISEKEKYLSTLRNEKYSDLVINNAKYSIYDISKINKIINQFGIFYSVRDISWFNTKLKDIKTGKNRKIYYRLFRKRISKGFEEVIILSSRTSVRRDILQNGGRRLHPMEQDI